MPTLFTAATIVLACTVVLAWPLLKHRMAQWNADRSIVAADDSTQWDLIRTYLQHLHPYDSSRNAHLYFDTKSAMLCADERPEPCDRYEFLVVGREDALVDRTYTAVPLDLQRKLDRMALARTYNPDPRLSNVQTLTDAEKGAFDRICRQAAPNEWPLLIRMSRAAVDDAGGHALAMVLVRNCEAYESASHGVASFTRTGDGGSWTIVESNVAMRSSDSLLTSR
ncbi:hypothetical protein QLQ15_01675 [Lysobacter sp. LF1]|uniref:Uncharacterized protein n=1 Tax=Lysobacter stagni TaxID=3045172 RepID=A0ABT6XCH1_9GAMM|nr:hypothetical protein [Lysobacter sp. LF1]MDI9237618.1 hypothetical protein [Lysobacter sp. LF1]